jgi:hypothetical protein
MSYAGIISIESGRGWIEKEEGNGVRKSEK